MRNFTVLKVEQRTPEWYAARCGRLTASRAGDMMAKLKGRGEAAARRDLRLQLVCERLTGQSQDDAFISKEMQRGTDLEGEARLAYEAQTGNLVRAVGFLSHNELLAGGSPDGVIGDFEGLVELKVPKSATHLRYLRARTLPVEHSAQIVALLWLSGANYCDFFSFDPRFPSSLRTFLVRVQRDEAALKSYELLVRMFLAEVERECEEVRQLAGEIAA
jgi:hypothetical protein